MHGCLTAARLQRAILVSLEVRRAHARAGVLPQCDMPSWCAKPTSELLSAHTHAPAHTIPDALAAARPPPLTASKLRSPLPPQRHAAPRAPSRPRARGAPCFPSDKLKAIARARQPCVLRISHISSLPVLRALVVHAIRAPPRHSPQVKSGRFLAPPGSRRITYFLDDLHLPEPNAYGSQPPLELLRQVRMARGGGAPPPRRAGGRGGGGAGTEVSRVAKGRREAPQASLMRSLD
jgi:hypothetical protein